MSVWPNSVSLAGSERQGSSKDVNQVACRVQLWYRSEQAMEMWDQILTRRKAGLQPLAGHLGKQVSFFLQPGLLQCPLLYSFENLVIQKKEYLFLDLLTSSCQFCHSCILCTQWGTAHISSAKSECGRLMLYAPSLTVNK